MSDGCQLAVTSLADKCIRSSEPKTRDLEEEITELEETLIRDGSHFLKKTNVLVGPANQEVV